MKPTSIKILQWVFLAISLGLLIQAYWLLTNNYQSITTEKSFIGYSLESILKSSDIGPAILFLTGLYFFSSTLLFFFFNYISKLFGAIYLIISPILYFGITFHLSRYRVNPEDFFSSSTDILTLLIIIFVWAPSFFGWLKKTNI